MSFANKYYTWLHECTQIINKKKKEERRKKILTALVVLDSQKKKKKYRQKRYWVEPIFQQRSIHGFYHALFPTIALEESRFRNYFRMTASQYEDLLCLVAPLISKQTMLREPISAAEQLSLTIRFLASGDSMTSISYQYLVGLTTVSKIIGETCSAIWTCLHKEVLPSSLKKEDWLNISSDFEEKWNFNHCIGAIDGRHIVIQCSDNTGSSYFNYKHTHSIVLLGICNANYVFTFVDIGAYGRRSDGGIFRDSIIGQKFNAKQMNVPEPEPITSDGIPLPYVLVGDEAFQLTEYLLRPYPGKGGLNQDRTIYNYRLSRARRTIENTFGILVSQWRIFRRPIICSVDKTMKIVQAVVCLHNWLREQDIGENQYITETMIDHDGPTGFSPGTWREHINDSALQGINRCGTNNSSRNAMAIRNEFCKYFNSEGAVPWQFKHC